MKINLKLGIAPLLDKVTGAPTALNAAVTSQLREVNGTADAHTFTAPHDILSLARDAESQLDDLGIPKSERAGAAFTAASGGTVPSAYKYSRKITKIKIVRGTAAWFLVAVASATTYEKSPAARLTLTAAQDARAVENLRKKYSVLTKIV